MIESDDLIRDAAAYILDKSVVSDWKSDIINRHGLKEWHLGVITTYIHGHLGIFSILGVKMGLFAQQMLLSSEDRIRIHSYTGHNPPLSCLNDGLQVSTKATLGNAGIKIYQENPFPEAIFIGCNQKIHIRLKEALWYELITKLSHLKNSIDATGYWVNLEKIAVKYWLEWERDRIFDVY